MTNQPSPMARVQEIVEQALALPTQQRAAYLDETCGADAVLRGQAERLLAVDDEALDFLESPVFQVNQDEHPADIGPYRIDGEIGRGGMGTVYRAVHQGDEMGRPVAVKVLKRGMDTEDIVRRFHAEREILARLEHPNVARLISGGTTQDGRPYFVMEYVDGEPLHHYCDNRQLDTRARIDLFRKVCSAIYFAHRNLVVHRDLKPSNILVNRAGEPKLLDFGIAKVIHDDPEATYVRTRTGLQMMTPEYAAPEQVTGGIVTTATDIYSLGVVLYELLTGHRPYQLNERTPEALRRAILDTLPAKPSTVIGRTSSRLNTDGSVRELTPASVCAARRSDPKRLRRLLAGDLDTIILTALRKDPEARYASAEQLAEDLGRFLDGYPILARRETLGELVSRVARHYRKRLAATALVFLLLLAAVGYWNQKRRAELERRMQSNLRDVFLENIARFDPLSGNYGKEVDARTFLDDTLERADTRLADDPVNLAAIYNTSGKVYLNLGDGDRAFNAFSKALALRPQIGVADQEVVADSLLNSAEILFFLGDHEDARDHAEEATALFRELFGNEDVRYAKALAMQAEIINALGQPAQALNLLNEAYAVLCNKSEPPPDLVVQNLMTFALVTDRIKGLSQMGMFECESCTDALKEAYALHKTRIGKPDGQLAILLSTMAAQYMGKFEFRSAAALLKSASEILETLVDSGHPRLIEIWVNMGRTYNRKGDFDQGIPLVERGLDIARRLYHPDHENLMAIHYLLGLATLEAGRIEESEIYLEKALALARRREGVNTVFFSNIVNRLGQARTYRKDYARAEDNLLEGLQIRKEALGTNNAHYSQSLLFLASLYFETGEYELAEYLAAETAAIRNQSMGHAYDMYTLWSEVLQFMAAAMQGRPYEALAELERFNLELMKKDWLLCDMLAMVNHTRAWILASQGDLEGAVLENDKALSFRKEEIRSLHIFSRVADHQIELLKQLGREGEIERYTKYQTRTPARF
ncbi:MAG: serine/threonine-protein kinase [Acidobacteriota bacterium]|nr:serine/threonine-protein kinase [Acidobacteriota bacterium]